MAEIEGGGGNGKHKSGHVNSKKASTKVDMTPMVDLAFLLITFFMLTTTLNKPQVMPVNMPQKTDKKTDKMEIKNSQSVTLLICKNEQLYYYTDIENPELIATTLAPDGLRSVLKEQKNLKKELVVVVKATKDSKFKSLVDVIDEMHIGEIERFGIVPITEQDEQLIIKKEEIASN